MKISPNIIIVPLLIFTLCQISSILPCKIVYFEMNVPQEFRQFYYYNINFTPTYEALLNESLKIDFRNLFSSISDKSSFPPPDKHIPFSYYTVYAVSAISLPKFVNNNNNDSFIMDATKSFIQSVNPYQSSHNILLLPEEFSIPGIMSQRQQFWINDIAFHNHTMNVRLQLYRWYKDKNELFSVQLPMPLKNPPPFNYKFSVVNNNHCYLFIKSQHILLSTIITPLLRGEGIHNNKNTCIFPFPSGDVLKLNLTNNENYTLRSSIALAARIHEYLSSNATSESLLHCNKNNSSKWCDKEEDDDDDDDFGTTLEILHYKENDNGTEEDNKNKDKNNYNSSMTAFFISGSLMVICIVIMLFFIRYKLSKKTEFRYFTTEYTK